MVCNEMNHVSGCHKYNMIESKLSFYNSKNPLTLLYYIV